MGDQTAHSPRWAAVWALAGRQHGAVSHSQLIELGLGHKAAIARRAGLPVPETRVIVNAVEVNFWFPELGLVVEVDSLKYHRTPIKRLKDVRRDQEHFAADVFVGPGVTVGTGTVVGARSSVFADLPAWTVCVGSPARPVKERRPVEPSS